ncbi:MAG TPA: hypothetical protein DCR24_05435 [Bacillus bacterium]|nr:hypothetical protein [Bacillus sp. (in: firmicutes)]
MPFILKKQPVKDWILIFFLKAFYSVFFDSFVLRKKKITYPVRLLPQTFNINILFDVLLFPITCVHYNQMTYHSTFIKTVLKVFVFSTPISIGEIWLEKNTKLIKYHDWHWFYSFMTLTTSFWLVRATIYLIRKFDRTSGEDFQESNV